MRMEQIREIANAVLYEGYLLYPYRHSAIKNRQRWTIGVVYPRDYSEAHGDTEPWTMRTECLISGPADATLDVTMRFLHLLTRTTVSATAESETKSSEPHGAIGWAPDSWEEGMEREVTASALALGDLLEQPRCVGFEFPAARLVERVAGGTMEVVREHQPLAGAFVIAAEPVATTGGAAFKLSIRIENTTPLHGAIPDSYNAAMLSAFVSTHTILQVRGGVFVSLLDPSPDLHVAASDCRNERTFPVLVGDAGALDTMLSSPIILYDYPQIAPESAGSLFDGTEIDEILTLRILALTDEEKAEMRQGDERTCEILERTESLTAEQLRKLHGVIRSLGPAEGGGA
jgi:hypothetical protein